IDSWGRSSLIKRKVTVYPYNDLEYNYINIKNNETNESILKIRFDDINKKLVVDKVDKSKIPSSLNSDTEVFKLKLIKNKKDNLNTKTSESNQDSNSEELEKGIVLTKADLLNNDKINEINELSYDGFEYISLWVYNSEDGISISKKSNSIPQDEVIDSEKSNQNSSNEILLNGFDSSEKMQNTRFKIRAEGLEKIYNEGPKINGLNNTLYVYKNTDIKREYALNGISVSSNIDTTISNEDIVITNVDNENLEDLDEEISTIGNFILKYTVTDSWGRSATYNRTVSVISKSVSNDIEFYNENGSKNLFSLKYNPISNIFDVSKKVNNSINNGSENNPPSEEQPPQDQSPDESEESSQGTDGELKAKTGNLSEGNNDTVQDNIPNEGNPDQDDNPSVENPPQDSNNSQDGEGSEGSNDIEDNTEQTKKEIVFKLAIFNGEEKKVGEIELTEEETINIEEFKKKLSNITIYDGYYVSVWSNKPERIKIKGYMTGNNELGESGDEEQDYSQTITKNDYIDNVRFNLTEDGIHAVYNKAPKITVTSKEMLTAYAGDIIDYTKNIEVKDDRDNEENGHIIDNSKIKVTIIPKEANGEDQPIEGEGSSSNEGSSDARVDTYTQEESSTETEEEAFRKEEEKHLKIGKNTIRLTVEDSWGRATSIERNLLILNGIDKNQIIFNGVDNQEIIRIRFNHITKKLDIITQNRAFGNGQVQNYVKIAVYGKDNIQKGSEVTFNVNENPSNGNKLNWLKENYTFEYGDYFKIYHGHPDKFVITGGINNQRENYTDGAQNPENLLNVKFVITESGLKSVYTNPDETKVTDNKVIFGPIAPEKFPFKIQIDFNEKKFKVVETTQTNILYGHNEVVYKMVLIGSNGRIKRETTFLGREDGNAFMFTDRDGNNTNDKNWNNQSFEYNDCLYLWHSQPNRSIIKGDIKKAREDYSNGVDDADNMNHVVFKLTETGLESIYNEAPKIEGVEDIDIYQGESFNPSDKVTYSDDHDTSEQLQKSIAIKQNGTTAVTTNVNSNGNNDINLVINTQELGEKILVYTATDRWGKTTRVERKVTVRPNLYKNVFKVYPQISNEQPATKTGESVDNNSSIEGVNPEVTTPPNSNLGSGNTGDSTLNSGNESSENTGSSSSSSGSNSSTQNKPWQYEENKTRKPAFEIGFDTITNKYKVYNQTNERLSNDKLDETAFAIQIKNAEGNEKKKIILTGNDRGTSPKLSELNDVSYADNDIIRVYRSDLKGIEITGTVTGNIPTNDQMNNDNNKFDYMKNTGFKVSNAGLQAIYNKAPVINEVKKVRTISKGTVDLLQGITVSDEIDEDISLDYMYIYVNDELIGSVNQNRNSNENYHRNYEFNKVGTYKVKYLLYDRWQRVTEIETTVKVESKTRENEIKVYGPNDLNSSDNPAFRIVFDTKNNKILLKGPSEESIVDKEDRDDATESAKQENNNSNNNQNSENQDSSSARTSTENYFEIVVRSSKGEEKVNISLNGDTEHNKGELKKIHELEFDKYDTISLKAQNPNAVKITGNIISENSNGNSTVANSYENGFGTTDKYSQVRFKITDDGLKEITQKNLVINGATNTTIKRGDTLDLLEGVSVNVNDQNNDDYKLTVEEITSNAKAVTIEDDESDTDDSSQNGTIAEDKNKFTKLKEGIYTVKYTATNSWGVTTTVDRKITVEPRTDLEKVKLTVKDRDNNNVLVIGFDSIERKLRVLEYKNRSIDYLDNSQVFEINAFDSLGKTLGTIALRGSQQIDETIINRINAFPYEEGYSLSVWSKELENRINIDGTIKVDNSSKEESKKIRYKRNLSAEQKKDKMENGRFEILSDGLKYIYNEAPKFEGDTSTAIPYYKGNLLKAPDTLKVTDDHDGIISPTEVTINDDNVDYDTLGIQNITYVVEDSWGRRSEKSGKIEIRSAMDSNSINIYPKENSTTSGSTSESIQQPNQDQEGTIQGKAAQTRTTEIEAGKNGNISGDTNKASETADSAEGGTQTPSGSTDGSVENTPEGGNNIPGSGSEGTTTTDNEVVKNSSFSIKFVRDNEHNKNRIQVDLGSKSSQQFDPSKTGTFLKVKIYDANGIALKSVDILGTDTGEEAKRKIEEQLNKVNSDSTDSKNETEDEETEQPQTKTISDVEDSTDSSTNSTNSTNGSSQNGSNSSNKNDQQFEYFNGQYIAIEGVTDSTKNSVKIQGTVVNKDKDVTYENGVSDIDKIQNVRFKFTDLGLEAVYNKAPTIKIDDKIK
ncbi:hypothetical protein, partial [uncultured Clostridium sp.]|uniref:hypothetical protein n=1 Tax=uncultured Clostridium sp. TaxID=59620 RepID=UPI002672CE2B